MGNGLAIGHLLTLQEIEIDMSDFLDHEWHDVMYIMLSCASCCPLLEVWRGTFPRNSKIDALARPAVCGIQEPKGCLSS